MYWLAIAQSIVTALLVAGIFASRKHVKNWLLHRQVEQMLDGVEQSPHQGIDRWF
jgi:hypothetical protein